jgi:hypothetical protein
MSGAARSLKHFGVYLGLLGAVLIVAPKLLLGPFGLPLTSEVWLRVVGMLLFFNALYYRAAALGEQRAFFRVTVLTRATEPFFFGVFVAAAWVRWPLLLFGLIDLAGAAWTYLALRRDAAQ